MPRFLTFLAVLLLIAPALAAPTAEELQANRRRFEQLRRQPEQLEKLRAEARAFRDLPEERRDQIAELHEKLQKEPATTQARLQQVAERYAEWLERLDEPTRVKLAAIGDKQKRLEFIRTLREDRWLNDQPKAIRDKAAMLPLEERRKLISKEKEDERQRRIEWTIAGRFWNDLEGDARGRKTLPTKLTELPPAVQTYVRDYLLRMFLSPEEKGELAKAEGQWPQYPMKLVELADKHPAALPGPNGPKFVADLPKDVHARLKPLKKDVVVPKSLRLAEGQWPQFGEALVRFAKQKNVNTLDHEFLAFNFDCLDRPMQEFEKKTLEKAAEKDELQRLLSAQGKWPDYPKTIQDIADNHGLRPPWFVLPRVENWDNYRLNSRAAR